MTGANMDNRLFAEYYPSQTYQCKGGGFPSHVSGTGMVGMIGVSGLSAEEDHEVCAMALWRFLVRKNGGKA